MVAAGEGFVEVASLLASVDADREQGRRSATNAAMDRYADGDDSVFGALYDELGPRLYRFILRQTRNPEAAEDIVQQTMMQIHCARDRFRRGADVLPWAFAIARRLHIDMVRRRKHQELLTDDGESHVSARAPVTDAPDEMLYGKQLEAAVIAALARVPESQREAFMLVRVEGLSVIEAAEVIGISVPAMKVRAHRAYEAMREALAENEEQRVR